MVKKRTPQQSRKVADPDSAASRWKGFSLLLWIAIPTGLIIGIVVLLTPLESPPPIGSSGSRLKADQEPTNDLIRPIPTWPLPTDAEQFQMEELQAELLREAKRLVQSYPQSTDALDLAASIHYDLNRLPEADELWKACLALEPANPNIYLEYARFLTQTEKPEQAIQVLEAAHTQQIETAGTYHQLAAAYERSGNLEKASEISMEVNRRFPGFGESWLLTGKIQNQLGQFPQAEASLRQALTLEQSEFDVLKVLVPVLARQGKREEAAGFAEKMKALQTQVGSSATDKDESTPFQEKFAASLRDRAARFFLLASVIEKKAWNNEDSMRLLRRNVQLKPNDPAGLVLLTERYVESKQTAEAIEVSKRLVQLQPENVVHFTNLASLAFQQNDLGLAEETLKRAIKKHPDVDGLTLSLAKSYITAKKPAEARELMQEFLASRQHPEAYMVLGAAYKQLGDIESADRAFSQAKQLAEKLSPPTNPIPK
jgi:tetratricopeptide (TPR) repeat protein